MAKIYNGWLMNKVQIEKINEVYNKIYAETSILMELSDYFTFDVPGAKFSPQFRQKRWDGKIRLLNVNNQKLYAGLSGYVEHYCNQKNYEVEFLYDNTTKEFSIKEAEDFIKTLNLTLTPRDYQIESFVKCVRDSRALLLSPTSSGKSLIIYLLYRYYNKKTLLIVPTTSLIHQMYSDFISYGYDEADNIHKIYEGQTKTSDCQLFISTWQSIFEMPKKWFNQFDVVIGDEAHNFKAKSLTSILTKLENCKYRFGTTGTLDGSLTNKLVLEGLFGPVKTVISTSEMIEKKYASDFKIKSIVLNYNDSTKKTVSKYDYQQEIDFIISNEKRNRFIINLALSLKGNTLILFRYVDRHGKMLYNSLLNSSTDKDIYFISGEIDGLDRDDIRNKINNSRNSITVASEGTTSTGVNIPELNNIIFASPSKARIKTLQSIGRVLRKTKNKTHATLYDISDDLSWKNKKNYTLFHFMERIKIYNEEKFSYRIYKVSIDT